MEPRHDSHSNMSSGDPFNFDDVFTKLGADGLVKKPMVKKAPAPAAIPPGKGVKGDG